MAPLRAKQLGFLLCLAGLAGCVEGTLESTDEEQVAEGLGGIRGTLLSEELFPVALAFIEIPGVALTTSDQAGRFEFLGLPEGKVVLNVSAEGYEPKREEVVVPSEGFAEVRIAMVGIPGKSPYSLTLIRDGVVTCAFSFVYSAGGVNPCPAGATNHSFTTEVGPNWRAGVHEMEWQTAEEMLFASTLDGPVCRASPPPTSKCAALLGGRSPLKVVARPENTEYAAQHAVDSKTTWPTGNYTSTIMGTYSGYLRTEINATFNPICQEVNAAAGAPRALGCPFGIGFSPSSRFRFYHTTFYLQSPDGLDDFTARPDA